jgi:glycosyltransferase involved in cell wall biosynthesis
MVARMLNLCGLYLGEKKDLIPPAADNPEGFWENLHFHETNERILTRLGGSWDIPPAFPPGWETDSALDPLRQEAKRWIDAMSVHPAWGWKDPRNSLTLPFWRQLIPDLKIVVCLRHPVEVARSLSQRGYSSGLFSARLWLAYYRRCSADAPESSFLFTHYDSYFRDAGAELDRLLEFIGLPADAQTRRRAAGIVEEGRRHAQIASRKAAASEVYPETEALYRSLCTKAGPVFPVPHVKPEPAAAAAEKAFSTPPPTGGTGDGTEGLRSFQDREDDLTQSVRTMKARAAEQAAAVRKLTEKASRKDDTVRSLEMQVREREAALQSLEAQAKEQAAAIREWTGRVEEKNREIRSLSDRIAEKEQAATELAARARNAELQLQGMTAKYRLIRQTADQQLQELEEIRGGAAWGVFQFLHKARASFIPSGSRRERGWRSSVEALRVWRREGLGGLLRRTRLRFSIRGKPATAGRGTEDSAASYRQLYVEWKNTIQQRDAEAFVPISEEKFPRGTTVKAIAFYCSSFQPAPENDDRRGRGFTDWTDVSKAVPNFIGHSQPNLPGELGFYDQRLPEILKRQVELARQYGIRGFCFQFAWSAGKGPAGGPLQLLLEDRGIDFPFCLCWSNGPRGDREEDAGREIPAAPDRNEAEYVKLARDLLPAFRDPRCIRVDGKPLMVVDRVDLLPDARTAAEGMRAECRRNGIDGLYLVAGQRNGITDPRPLGFDAAVEFPPHHPEGGRWDPAAVRILNPKFSGRVYEYSGIARWFEQRSAPEYPLFRTVMPAWDDTARNQNAATMIVHASPELYQEWLGQAAAYTRRHLPEDRNFLFINSWNGWGNAAYLEPDRRLGYAYLRATAQALAERPEESPRSPSQWTILFVSHDANQGGAQDNLLNTIAWMSRHTSLRLKILCLAGGGWLDRFAALADTITLDDLRGADSPAGGEWPVGRLREFCGGTPDLVYGNSVVAGREYARLRRLGSPILTFVHELESSIRYYAKPEWMADIARYSARFLACSRVVRNNLIARHAIPPDAVTVNFPGVSPGLPAGVPEGNEKTRIRERLGLDKDKHIVFGCGLGMAFRKGADLFIELGGRLRSKGIGNFHMYWIGNLDLNRDDEGYGAWPDHLDRLKNGELNSFVTFLGTKENPREYFRAGDAFVLTSREEPFGLVALEAADSDLPVLCFEGAGVADFVGEDAGVVVPDENLEAMADHLAGLLADPARRSALGSRASEKIREGFTAEQSARRVLSHCRQTAGRKPAVSVIVPNYNHAEYLPQRLDSIFNQTFQDFEVILLDDASTDGSPEVFRRYADRGDVRIFRNPQNGGSPFPQWWKGIQAARSDVLWIAESDDSCEPDFLEALLPAFSDPGVNLAYANSHILNEAGRVVGDYLDNPYLTDLSPTKWRSDYKVTAEQEINDALGVKDTILNASAVLFRKFAMDADFQTDFTAMRIAGDWFFFAHAIQGGWVQYDARKLNYHRRHSESVIGKTLQEKKLERFFEEFRQVQTFIFRRYPLSGDFQRKWEEYLRKQWNDFYPGRPFEELNAFYPIDRMRELIEVNRRSRSG